MGWHPQKLKDALLPILIVNWILGLGIVEYPLGKPRLFISLIYVIILICGYLYIPVTRGFNACSFHSTTITHLDQIILIFHVFFALSSIIICWYYQKELKICIQRIELIDETLECLGSNNNWIKIFIQQLLRISLTFIGMGIVVVSDFYWYFVRWNTTKSLYCSFSFNIPIILLTVGDLTFEMVIRCIEFSMKKINLLLEKSLHKNTIEERYYNLNKKRQRIATLIMCTEFNSESTEKTRNKIQLLKHLHLELSIITWDVNKIFGLQIIMSTVSNIILIIYHAYYLYNAVLISVIISTTSWCITRFMRIVLVNNVGTIVTDEALKTKEIIYKVQEAIWNSELKDEIEQFSLQINQRPLTFSMCGVFTLERGLIGKVLATAVTYLVCLIQIAPSDPLIN